MLEVSGLEVRYGPVTGVTELTLQVAPGEIVTLLGANGAGKSSVLNAVAGLVPAARGEVVVGGTRVTAQHAARRVGHGLALVVEGRGVFADLSVRENLELGTFAKPALRRAPARRAAIDRVVELFPRLGERMAQTAGSLSGGEQQMLVIGRALVARPRLLLLDEPSLGLAPRIVAEISQTLVRLARDEGLAILVAEQNATLGLDLAHRGYVLTAGRMALSGRCEALRADDRVSALYFGGARADAGTTAGRA